MKSEISTFWTMLQSDDELIHDEGYRLSYEFARKNPQYFQSIKKWLPKKFVSTYEKINFHDFHILNIEYYSSPPKKSKIRMVTHDYHEEYGKDMIFDFVYRDIKEYSCFITSALLPINWSRDIFEILDNGLIMHRILCSNRVFFDITAKSIEIKSYQKRD